MENTQNVTNSESTKSQVPRDVFLYLLNVIVLAFVATNLGVLLFQFVNLYVPDVLQDRYAFPGMYDSAIRWAVATLVIVFPVYVWVTRFLQRDIATNPEKRQLRVRRWLLYLTLFVAGLVIIGDLVALVYNFLEGELSGRFFAKVMVIFGISGSIFYYYLNDLREKSADMRAILAKGVIAAVAVAVVAGLFTAGLPQDRRLVRLDDQRTGDLMNIQQAVVNYWLAKNKLPAGLGDLDDKLNGYQAPVDPVTGESYVYKPLGGLNFELCAVFSTESEDLQGRSAAAPNMIQENWQHPSGQYCFERTIDPDQFRQPILKPIL